MGEPIYCGLIYLPFLLMKKLLLLALALPVFGYGQFMQNFDGGSTIPAGWTVINNGSANTWQIVTYTGTLTTLSGTNSATIMYSSAAAHNDYLITPAITVTQGVSDFLSFHARSRDPLYPEQISLKLSTTGVAAADFTTTLEAVIAPPSGPTYHNYTYDLSNYVGQTIYIAFHSQTFDKFAFDLENVEVTALPACPAPTNVTVSQIETNSAFVSWAATEGTFEIEYGPAGFTQGEGTFDSAVDPFTLEGLSASTTYDLYIRAHCNDTDISEWVGPVTFSTLCDAVTTFPYFQGFESTGLPACWSNETLSGDYDWEVVSANGNGSITPRTGSGMAEFRTDNMGDEAILISPPLDLANMTNPQLTFYYANVNWFGDVDELRVFYRTSATGEWTLLGEYTDEMTQWTEVTLDLPNPSSTYYVGFMGTSEWARGLNLDDITIDGALSTPSLDAASFRYFPNPVSDVLNLNYSQDISKVEVYNMIGQLVLSQNVNAASAQVNLSGVNAGTYLVKVFSANQMNTVKVIKK